LKLTVNRILLFEEESDENLWGLALTSLTSLIRASTTSMTAVPKPLKFMIPHYDKMKQIYEKMLHSPVKG
jgi:26S proteasome regulatory subunit N1